MQPDSVFLTNWTNFRNLIEGTTGSGSQSRGDEEGDEALAFVILIWNVYEEQSVFEEKNID